MCVSVCNAESPLINNYVPWKYVVKNQTNKYCYVLNMKCAMMRNLKVLQFEYVAQMTKMVAFSGIKLKEQKW
jgi:hypothetical protein